MDNTDMRWTQHFNQFEKALSLLKSAIAIEQPTVIEQKIRQEYYPRILQLQQTFTDKTGKQ